MYFYRMCVFLVFSSGLIWSLPAYSLELPRCDKYFNFDALSQGNPDHAFFIDVHIPNELHDVIYRIIPMTPSLNYEELKIHYPYPDTIGYRLSCLYHSNGVLKQITDSVYRINIVPTVGYDEDGNEVYSEDAGFTMTPEEWLSQFEVVMKERYGIDIWHTDAVLSGMASKTIRIEYTDEPERYIGDGLIPVTSIYRLMLDGKTFDELGFYHDQRIVDFRTREVQRVNTTQIR